MTVVGIDVAASRPCTCVLVESGRILDWLDTKDLQDLAGWIGRNRPDVVAVDAPCATSQGLLRTRGGGGKPYAGRVCDRDLRWRGIPLYEVPGDRGSAPAWMEVGFQIYDLLREMGYQLPRAPRTTNSAIEVYPHASFVSLLGGTPAKKTRVEGRTQRIQVLERHGYSLDGRRDHDALDALVAALTAERFLAAGACAVGNPSEALIWLPVDRPKERYGPIGPHDERLKVRELTRLYEMLSAEDREELLHSLLIAASRGGEAVLEVLEGELLRRATDEVLAEHGERDD